MLNRYLGNKTALLDEILSAVRAHATQGELVCDVFSGSLAVSLALKRSGYRVAANDINLFSAVLGRAFILNHEVPSVSLETLLESRAEARRLRQAAERGLREYRGTDGYAYLEDEGHRARSIALLALLLHLEGSADSRSLAPPFRRTDFFDHYCEEGSRSAFTSSRGRSGRRRFFTAENARHIDAVLNRLRQWRAAGLLEDSLEAVLLSVLLRAVERVSNTQGTYHDFPRDRYDPRALQPMQFVLPQFDGLLGASCGHLVGVEQDSLDFISKVPQHAVLYLDPPYNFRQYTAYYFLPNVICRYPRLKSPAGYFADVTYVRGQNPRDDFTSTFCKANEFIPSLRRLVERADVRTVVMSYFDGRNHWNQFKSESNGEGYRRLTAFFEEELFAAGSLEVKPVTRLNYQSYGGYKAREVSEFLFVAQKSDVVKRPESSRVGSVADLGGRLERRQARGQARSLRDVVEDPVDTGTRVAAAR